MSGTLNGCPSVDGLALAIGQCQLCAGNLVACNVLFADGQTQGFIGHNNGVGLLCGIATRKGYLAVLADGKFDCFCICVTIRCACLCQGVCLPCHKLGCINGMSGTLNRCPSVDLVALAIGQCQLCAGNFVACNVLFADGQAQGAIAYQNCVIFLEVIITLAIIRCFQCCCAVCCGNLALL